MVFIVAYLAKGQTRNYVAMATEHFSSERAAQEAADAMGVGPIGPRKVVECEIFNGAYIPKVGDWPFPGNELG